MSQQRITLDPDPPIQGKPVTVCYDFDGLEIVSTTLDVSFSPDMGQSSHSVSPGNNCVTIEVPANANSITVEDQTGSSPDKIAPVDPQ